MGTAHHQEVGRSPPRAPRPAPQSKVAHDERDFLNCLAHQGRAWAERAALEFDALDTASRRRRALARRLADRQDEMVAMWIAAATKVRSPLDPVAIARVRHLRVAFLTRLRELRAAAAPGGHA